MSKRSTNDGLEAFDIETTRRPSRLTSRSTVQLTSRLTALLCAFFFLLAEFDPDGGVAASEVESLPVVVITLLVHADLIFTEP